MPKNRIDDLRNLMMETIERLIDPDDPMDAKTAIAVSQVGNVIINSAKAELQAAKFLNSKPPAFFQNPLDVPKQIAGNPALEIESHSEMPDCRCGETIYPADYEASENLKLDYPRCSACLSLLPKNSKDLNGGGK